MLHSYRRKLEFFLVAIIASILIAVAAHRYTQLAVEANVLRLRVISEHFMTGAVNIRAEYFLFKSNGEGLLAGRLRVNDEIVYLSDQGWPVSTAGPVLKSFYPSDADCYFLWNNLLQNPPAISIGQFSPSQDAYRVYAYGKFCRYAMTDDTSYFDYYPMTGRLLFSSFIKK